MVAVRPSYIYDARFLKVKACSLVVTKFLKDRSAFKFKDGGLGLLDPDITENLNFW